ncbi:hypothetical protein Tco_1039982 [Tanacetum coccineum]
MSQQPSIPPNRDDWDHLFPLMFNEYFTPSSIDASLVLEATASKAMDLADSPVITKTPIFCDDPFNESPYEESPSQGSSSNMRQTHTPFEHLEPKNFKQERPKPVLIDAMQEEIHEFERLQVKTDEFGRVLKNKARLVAQGFRQEEGIDFEESFCIVAEYRPSSILY